MKGVIGVGCGGRRGQRCAGGVTSALDPLSDLADSPHLGRPTGARRASRRPHARNTATMALSRCSNKERGRKRRRSTLTAGSKPRAAATPATSKTAASIRPMHRRQSFHNSLSRRPRRRAAATTRSTGRRRRRRRQLSLPHAPPDSDSLPAISIMAPDHARLRQRDYRQQTTT